MNAQKQAMKNTPPGESPVSERGLLEEFNIPPHIASFLRENAKNIIILAGCIVVLILAWSAYDHYRETKQDKTAALLTTALSEENKEIRAQLLEDILQNHSGTDAAVWSELELGHLDYDAGKFTEAAEKYKSVLGKVKAKNPVTPLVHYSLAHAFESMDNMDQALLAYQNLGKTTGFEDVANSAIGRIYEEKGETTLAIEAYEKVNDSTLTTGWVKDKLAELKSKNTTASITNKE